MKGNPRLRLALVALGIGLLGVPVWSVTQNREAPPVVVLPPSTEELIEVDLVIESSAPCRVEVVNATKPIFSAALESAAAKATVRIPSAGADLVVSATGGNPDQRFAVRVEASHDGSQLADVSFWGTVQLTGVLSLPSTEETR